MSFLTPSQACLKLASDLSEHPLPDSELKRQHEEVVSSLRAAANDPSSEATGVRHVMGLLAPFFYALSDREDPSQTQLSTLLANATREVELWRPLFGLPIRSVAEEDSDQLTGGVAPDCILEVARRIVSRQWHESRREQIRSALRIIANCCADNNVNRSLIVHRAGLDALMNLAKDKRECDLVIPTLYNVCIDYDEPAVDNEGKPWPPLQQMRTGSGQESGPALNAAEQKLGMFWNASQTATSVEILLGMAESAENCLGMLADLVEMASRVALYGIHYLVHSLEEDGSSELQETGSSRLVHALLEQGADIAKDPECSASICQAVLNVFSQHCCHGAVIKDDGAIWRLIHLPYAVEDEEEEDDSLAPYGKAILKLVYEISALDAYGNKFDPESTLIRDCVHSLEQYAATDDVSETTNQPAGPWAAICVLIANSITSTDRAVHLIRSSSIASSLATLIANASDPDTLLPAVDLAIRLALCRDGQDALHEAGMMSAVHRLLKHTSEIDAVGMEIQRETVALMRLLVKGRPEYLSDLYPDSSLREGNTRGQTGGVLAATMSLFHNTTDTRTKTEIGRLSIEVVRIIFSSPQSSLVEATATGAQPELSGRGDIGGSKLLSQVGRSNTPGPVQDLTIADTIASIITQPQPQSSTPSSSNPSAALQAEGEAWFGLALLSNLPLARPWILAALGRNHGQLLARLRDIVATFSSAGVERDTSETDHGHGQGGIVATSTSASEQILDRTRTADPRYENIKVLILQLLQSSSTTGGMNTTTVGNSEGALTEEAVWKGLKSSAAELGF